MLCFSRNGSKLEYNSIQQSVAFFLFLFHELVYPQYSCQSVNKAKYNAKVTYFAKGVSINYVTR